MYNELPEDCIEKTTEMMQNDPEFIEAELNRNKALANLADKTSASVIQEYDKRILEINKLTKSMESRAAKLADTEETIEDYKNAWVPALEELIGKVNENFMEAFTRVGI